jgi:DNA-binding response OmpR family regulator
VGKTILFVDDDQDWRQLVASELNDAGHDVVTAQDASEALSKIEGVPLDLAILDLNLGGEDGLVLMQFLRRNNPDVPIIIFTGAEHNGVEIMNMLQRGASYYVRKKGSLDELLDAINRVLR